MKNRKLFITEDGSSSFYLKNYDESFHSKHGAFQESQHIYIDNGLRLFKDKRCLNILELGFGTGLNALLTYIYSKKNGIRIKYTAIELFPLQKEEIEQLNYPSLLEIEEEIFNRIEYCNWREECNIDKAFRLNKMEMDIRKLDVSSKKFDLVYFDAFNPDIQADLWSQDVFYRVYKSMKPNSYLLTYSVKGLVKRNLKKVGFDIKKLGGAKGKREILRASKNISV